MMFLATYMIVVIYCIYLVLITYHTKRDMRVLLYDKNKNELGKKLKKLREKIKQ